MFSDKGFPPEVNRQQGGKRMVYIDVLFCVNFVIDYLLLQFVKAVLSLRARRLRLLGAAALGGVGAFVLLLPPMPFWLSAAVSVAQAGVMIGAAFLPVSPRMFFKASGLLFCISFCFCGAMTAVEALFSPRHTMVRNSAVYIGIPPMLFVGLTLVIYAGLRLFYRLMNKGASQNCRCEVTVVYGGSIVRARGLVDTGNTLHEPFSGKCVLVGREEVFGKLFPAEKVLAGAQEKAWDKGVRLVPFSSVGGSGVLPAFHPSEITVCTGKTTVRADAYLAVSHQNSFSQDCDVIVPAELIMKGS